MHVVRQPNQKRKHIADMKLSALLLVASAAAVSAHHQYKFSVANLDGKKGERGSFVMEVHDEWAPLGHRAIAIERTN